MPDWNEINRRKRKEINLGMAKNGAIEMLKHTGGGWANQYKSTARLLFLLNQELDEEILDAKLLAGKLEVIP